MKKFYSFLFLLLPFFASAQCDCELTMGNTSGTSASYLRFQIYFNDGTSLDFVPQSPNQTETFKSIDNSFASFFFGGSSANDFFSFSCTDENEDNWTQTYDVSSPTAFTTHTLSGVDCAFVLPVDVSGWYAKNVGKNTVLTIETETETNNDYFEIERSFDRQNWEYVAEINGSGTTYESRLYTASIEASTEDCYYRYKQFDFDGTETIGELLTVEGVKERDAVTLFPNPVRDVLFFDIENDVDAFVEVIGFTSKISIEDRRSIDVGFLPSGLHTVRFSRAGRIEVFKVLKL